jgi:hypothetical protein
VERELYIRSKLFATGYADSSQQAIVVPSYLQSSSFTVPIRLFPSSATEDSGNCAAHGCQYTYDSKYIDLNLWNAGHGAPAWIEYDLGSTRTLRAIRLVPEQWPEGNAVHRIYAGNTPSPTTLIETIIGNGAILEPFAKELNAVGRYVRIHTESSTSWVAWREVEIYGY